MYNIKISCKDENNNASYNIDIDTDVTVTATVLDFNGNPVVGENLTIYYDDETSIYTGTTDSNGQISTTYTCTEWGTHVFSVETYICFINVNGWKTYLDTGASSDPHWIVEYNETTTRVTLSYSQSQSVPTSVTNYGTTLFPDSVSYLRPSRPVMFTVYNGAMIVLASNSVNTMQRRTIYGTSQFNASSQYWQVEWTHQGLP